MTKWSFFYLIKIKIELFFLVIPTFDTKLLLKILIARCCGGTVITSAKHAELLQFKPDSIKEGFRQIDVFTWFSLKSSIFLLVNPTIDMKLLLEALIARCWGVKVNTSAFFYLIKIKIKHFFLVDQTILYIKRVSSKVGQNFCMFKGPLEAHVQEPHWAACLSEHIERGQWPKRLKVDGWESNPGPKTVSQVQLPRG